MLQGEETVKYDSSVECSSCIVGALHRSITGSCLKMTTISNCANEPSPAVFLECHDFRAWVEYDNTRAPVYGIQQSQRKMTGYISSELGRVRLCRNSSDKPTFSVHVQDISKPLKSASKARFFLDGIDTGARTSRNWGDKLSRATYRVSASEVKPLQFSAVFVTDDEAIAAPGSSAAQTLGTIRIVVERIIIMNHKFTSSPSIRGRDKEFSEHTLHESEKPMGAQSVSLGSAIPKPSRGVAFETVPWPLGTNAQEPWVVFEFNYRSAALLRAKGVMPDESSQRTTITTSTPRHDNSVTRQGNSATDVLRTASPRKRPRSDNDERQARREERERLKARLRELHSENEDEDVKDEENVITLRRTSTSNPSSSRKPKPHTPIAHPSAWGKGHVIDLTDLE